jgi:PIN domain nuclease of toxin-antitoxin system
MIIAHARVDAMPVIGKDALFDAYGIKRIW